MNNKTTLTDTHCPSTTDQQPSETVMEAETYQNANGVAHLSRREVLRAGTVLLSLSCCSPTWVKAQSSVPTPVGEDAMGWPMFYPDRTGSQARSYYSSAWQNGIPRYFEPGMAKHDPPYDDVIELRGNYDQMPYCDGHGILRMRGESPHLFFYKKPFTWSDVEITYEVLLVENLNLSNKSTGFLVGVRSEHQDAVTDGDCQGQTYYGCFRVDSRVGFQCERAYHVYFSDNRPHDQNGSEQRIGWPGGGGIPTGIWVTVKMVCYNVPGGVRLDLYRSLDHGRSWQVAATYSDLAGTPWPGANDNRWSDMDLLNHCGPYAFGPYVHPATSVWLKFDYADVMVRRLSIRMIQPRGSARLPSNVSLAPNQVSSFTGSVQTFTAVYSDPSGASNISEASLRAGNSNASSLYIKYVSAENKLYLLADTGYIGGFAPGSANVIRNSQGTLNCAVTTVSKAGNSLTIKWNLTPSSNLIGSQGLFMLVRNKQGLESLFEKMGTWTIR